LVDQLPQRIVDRVKREFEPSQHSEVLRLLACLIPGDCGGERIWNAILDRSHGFTHGVRELANTAQNDSRDVLW
jgi:hypothetical protein